MPLAEHDHVVTIFRGASWTIRNTYNTWQVIVGTVKKSTDTISSAWFFRKVF